MSTSSQSPQSVTEVTTTSWFSRLGSSIKSLGIAILILVAAIAGLFWNEGRAVKTFQSLQEGASVVISANPEEINPENEGKLIHFSGEARTPAVLSDTEFGINQTGLRLRRVVEMYQWSQNSTSTTVEKLGGGQETTTTYTYEKKWSEPLIDSSQFKEATTHVNPTTKPYDTQEWLANPVSVGKVTIPDFLLRSLSQYQTVPVTAETIQSLPYATQANLEVYNDHIYYRTEDPTQPQIGNIRIRYELVPLGQISVIAKQDGESLSPYETKNGRSLAISKVGEHTAQELFDNAVSSNQSTTVLIRILGIFMIFVAFNMLLAPLKVFGSFVPFIGRIVGSIGSFISGILAVSTGLLVIALAWITSRPIIAVGLLVLAVGTVTGLLILRKKNNV